MGNSWENNETERDELGRLWVTVVDETPWGKDIRHVCFGRDAYGDEETDD
jgi:hypothetical protein